MIDLVKWKERATAFEGSGAQAKVLLGLLIGEIEAERLEKLVGDVEADSARLKVEQRATVALETIATLLHALVLRR